MSLQLKTSTLPQQPGCYLYKDASGKIIYVGKAKDLRKRVSSYFQKKDHDAKTAMLVTQVADVDCIVTNTEVEALVLENTLIKKHYPKFNIDLKDSRRYAYLRIAKADIPWIEVARSKDEPGEYYGPFVSGAERKIILDVLIRNFRVLTRKASPKLRKLMDKSGYMQRISYAREILKGNVEHLIEKLQNNMAVASLDKNYEYALTMRNQISALKSLQDKQLMELSKQVDAHIINYLVSADEVYLLVFTMRKGVLDEKQAFSFPFREGFLDEFILQFYDSVKVPKEIVIPQAIDSALERYLAHQRGSSVDVLVPKQGDKKTLLELVTTNIMATFFTGSDRVTALKEALSLKQDPAIIECFDISHLMGTNTVASMVSFKNGMPDKANYRKFKMRIPTAGDDFLAMSEVVRRRYSRVLRENLPKPDLVVIDGGKGQLNVAIDVLKELGLKLNIISLAKEFEEIYIPSQSDPIRLPHTHKGLQLLMAIRDEAHRFAIGYQRLLRKKKLTK